MNKGFVSKSVADLQSIAQLIRAADKHITPELWTKDPWKNWSMNNANKCLQKAHEMTNRMMYRIEIER